MSASLRFIPPCLPSIAKSPPAGAAGLHQPKLDGYDDLISHLEASRQTAEMVKAKSQDTPGNIYAHDVNQRKLAAAAILKWERSEEG